MSEYWIEERRERLTTRRLPFQIAYKESSTGGFTYVPDEFLVHADLLGVLAGLLSTAGVERPQDRRPQPDTAWLDGTGLLAYGWSGDAEDLPGLVARMRAVASDNRVALHYVLSGETKVPTVPRGGPASAPHTPVAVSDPGDWGADDDAPIVAILDTGVFAGSQADVAVTPGGDPAVVFRRPTPQDPSSDYDDLYPAPVGPPLPTLGAEAGHGSFIASLIERMASGGVRLRMHKVLDVDGLGTEQDIVNVLRDIRTGRGPKPKVINLSLGGFTDDGGWVHDNPELVALYGDRTNLMPLALGTELESWLGDPLNQTVFVCAAGNDGQARPFWPAAAALEPQPSTRAPVVAVGSVNASLEPSEFSNTGPWVTVSTVGEDVVSDYPTGLFPVGPGQTESFPGGGAHWSGTSFAAPTIAAEIARRSLGRDTGVPLSGAAAWHQFREDLAAHARVPGRGWVWDPGTAIPARYPTRP